MPTRLKGLDVRTGGIYALEHIARIRPVPPHRDGSAGCFVREYSVEQWPPAEPTISLGSFKVRPSEWPDPLVLLTARKRH